MKEVKDTKYIPEDKKEISALFSGVRVSFSRIETLVTNEQLKEKFIELEHTLNNNTMTLREQVKKTMDLLVPFCKELNIKYNETLVKKFLEQKEKGAFTIKELHLATIGEKVMADQEYYLIIKLKNWRILLSCIITLVFHQQAPTSNGFLEPNLRRI